MPKKIAEDDLAALLAQWPEPADDRSAAVTVKIERINNPAIAEIAAEFEAECLKMRDGRGSADREGRKDRKDEASELRGQFLDDLRGAVEELAEAPDEIVLDLAAGEMRRDPKLEEAWKARRKEPDVWKRALEGLGKRIVERLPGEKPREKAAKRQVAARAASRTRITITLPDDPRREEDERMMTLPDHEFAQRMFERTKVRI